MTIQIRHILVAIGDLRQVPRNELRKAATLARAAHVPIELFHAIDEPDPARSFPETATRAEIEQHRAAIAQKFQRRLERFARGPTLRGVTVQCTAAWDYPPHEAVIRRARALHSGLVIAAARAHRLGGRLLLRNTDWELIRHCPVPLLLVKSPRPYRRPVVLAAVDPLHRHARPANLDARLLQAAGELARLLHGSLQVFHAFMPLVSVEPALMAAAPLVMMPPELEQAHTQQVDRAIQRLARKAGIARSRCHIRMGEVADELSGFTRRNGIAVVVMGAVSRSGLKRLFIGSAAERALDRLSCDVLVVKPRGFRSLVGVRPATTRVRIARASARRPRSAAVTIRPVPPPFL